MIVSRKEYHKAVERRARQIARMEAYESALQMAAKEIRTMKRRIARLEREAQKPTTQIKSYFIGPDNKPEERKEEE